MSRMSFFMEDRAGRLVGFGERAGARAGAATGAGAGARAGAKAGSGSRAGTKAGAGAGATTRAAMPNTAVVDLVTVVFASAFIVIISGSPATLRLSEVFVSCFFVCIM